MNPNKQIKILPPPCGDKRCWESGSESDCRTCPRKGA